MTKLLLVVAATSMLFACGGKKDKNAGNKKPVAVAIDAGAKAKPVAVAEVDVPTPADFEEEAESEVTLVNLEDELKKLEGELPEE